MTENNSAIVAEEAPAATLAPALDANQSAGLKRDLENDITSTSSKSVSLQNFPCHTCEQNFTFILILLGPQAYPPSIQGHDQYKCP